MVSLPASPRTILDVSSIVRWTGTPTGILRVEHALAIHALSERPDVILAVYDPLRFAFREVSRAWADRLVGWKFAIDVMSFDSRRHWSFLRRLRKPRHPLFMALERRRIQCRSPALHRAVEFVQLMLYAGAGLPAACIDGGGERYGIVPAELALGETLALGPGDTVFTAGYDWGNQQPDHILALRRRHGFRYVVMCHDALALKFPQFLPAHVVSAFRRYWSVMFSAADRILAVSHHVRDDIRERCYLAHIKPADICVIPPGVDPPRDQPPQPLPDGVEAGRFILYVSTLDPRKGHDMLLDVWGRLLAAGVPQRHRFKLVLVGRRGWGVDALMDRIEQYPALGDSLLHLSEADDTQLAALYAAAAFGVFPSHYEGFGLPIVEFFAHGKAVIASSAGALRETVNGLSPCIDPGDVEAWHAAIGAWIENPMAREACEAKIRSSFAWPDWNAAPANMFAAAAPSGEPKSAPLPLRVGERTRGLLCAGLYSSGSTWMFNLAVGMMKSGGRSAIATVYADEYGGDAEFFAKDSAVVFKSHRPGRSFRDRLKRGDLSLILTVREPRDAVASLMLRWDLDFELALARVESSGHALARLAGHPKLLLRYEEDFTGKDETLANVARYLGIDVPPELRADLRAGLTQAAVRSQIVAWRNAGLLGFGRPDAEFEPATHWHVGHVGDGKIGKWRAVLSDVQSGRVLRVTSAFCEAFGYPIR
jgi:glycosyltransferase involved in cell wall biosynthesis